MGIDPVTAMIITGGFQAISGASQARKAGKAAAEARGTAIEGPRRGLDLYFDMEQRMGGVPELGEFDPAQFKTLTDEDYDALQRSIFEERVGMYREPFEEALRGISSEEERRGISSLGTEQRYRLAGRVGDMLSREAASASATRYGLQLTEQGQLNPLRMAEAERRTRFGMLPTDLFFNRAQVAGQYAGLGTQAGTGAGQLGSQGFSQQSDIIGGTLGGISSLFGQATAYDLLKGSNRGNYGFEGVLEQTPGEDRGGYFN